LLDHKSAAIVDNVPHFDAEDFRSPPAAAITYNACSSPLLSDTSLSTCAIVTSRNVLLVLDRLGKAEIFAIPLQMVDRLARLRVFNGTDELQDKPHVVVH